MIYIQVLPRCIGLLTVTILMFSSTVFANDSSFGGIGADLTPQKRNDVIMVSENIKAVEKNGSVWSIEADYIFKNPTQTTIKFTMGFPERLCDPDSDCSSPSNDHTTFRDIITEVNGRIVKSKTESVSRKTKWGEELGRVHLFKVSFKPQETLHIKHRYLMGISSSVEGERRFDYVTKTGAMWGAPIGHATFTISVEKRPIGFHFPKDYHLKSYETTSDQSAPLTTVVFEQKNWTPKQDLNLTFTYEATQVFNCPPFMMVYHGPHDYLNQLKLSLKGSKISSKGNHQIKEFIREVQSLTSAQRKLCRNLPFARYGYRFKTPVLNQKLYAYAHPTPLKVMLTDYKTYTHSHDTQSVQGVLAVLFRPSKHYNEKQLTQAEWRYVKAIKLITKHLRTHK